MLSILICLQSTINTHQGHHDSPFSPGVPAAHDHEHETDEHKDYEKQVLLGEEEGAGYDTLSREEKVKRLR